MTEEKNLNEEMPVDVPENGTMETDFNLDSDFKADPIAAIGNYTGRVCRVHFETKGNCICWDVIATGNVNITMNDGETPVDGSTFFYRNWLPRSGDENIRTKSGKSTKRQAKINMLKQFQDAMLINMNTRTAVQEALENADWIGIPVSMQIVIDEYRGVRRNVINRMFRIEENDIPELEENDIPF
ncbi:MAG: hypothetical protein ACTSQA_00615 [Candidatus Heimdallarchaeaceae archaeon]